MHLCIVSSCFLKQYKIEQRTIQITKTAPHTRRPITILSSLPLQPWTPSRQLGCSSRRQRTSKSLSLRSLQRLWSSWSRCRGTRRGVRSRGLQCCVHRLLVCWPSATNIPRISTKCGAGIMMCWCLRRCGKRHERRVLVFLICIAGLS